MNVENGGIFSKAWYKVEGNDIYIYCRNGENIYKVKSNIKPYFFIKKKDLSKLKEHFKNYNIVNTNLKNLEGEEVVRIDVDIPYTIGKLARQLKKEGFESYEGDIPYVRRWMIDKDIHIKTDCKKLYIDFECKSDLSKPITEWKIISVYAMDNEGKEYFKCGEEKEVVEYISVIMQKYDIILGWNLDSFDRVVFENALKRNRLDFPFNTLNFIDLLQCYKFYLRRTLESWKLENVAMRELGKHKEVMDYSIFEKEVKDMTKEEIDLLKKYNKMDVELIKEIDEKLGLSDTKIFLASLGYVFPEETVYGFAKVIDSILLRKFRLKGYVLPNQAGNITEGKIKGALIKDYKRGIYENVAVFDVKGMYPTIIREFRISPEKEKEVIPSFIKDCIELRKHYKKEYEETKDKKYDLLQYALKILSNATYGYLLANFTRLYNEELGNMVTGYGRYILTLMVQYFEKCNLDVIAGDTDSCFVVMPNKDINIAITHRKGVEDYIKAKVNRDFTIELSRVYDKLFISGVKKRYVGYISYEDGEKLKEKKFDVVGFEIIRGDAFPLLKEVQEELFNLVLNSKNIDEIKDKGIEILKKYYKEMKKGKLDDKLCISVNRFKRMPKLSKSGKVIQTRQLKVLKKLEEKNIILPPTEKISYIVCDKKCEPIPFINNKLIENKKPNYDYYLERLANVAERILNISSSELCKLVKEEAIRGLENYVK